MNNPKYLVINIDKGLFTFEASLLVNWIAKSSMHGEFIEAFVKWLKDRSESNTEPYALASEIISKARVKDFIDTVIESRNVKIKCLECASIAT